MRSNRRQMCFRVRPLRTAATAAVLRTDEDRRMRMQDETAEETVRHSARGELPQR